MRMRYIYMVIMLLLVTACSDSFHEVESPESTGSLIVSASMKDLPAARASEEETNDGIIQVKSGIYTWSIDKDNSYLCQFVDGEGRIYPDGSSVPLQWSIFTYDGPYKFWLDNVLERTNLEYTDDQGKATFIGPVWSTEERKKYRAARDIGNDDKLVECDIVWDTTSVKNGQKALFDLTHRMSRTDVVLTKIDEYRDKSVTVKLTNLVLEPAAFNRINGEVLLTSPAPGAESPKCGDLTLLDNQKLTVVEENGVIIGRTPAFILPPQSAHDGDRKCFLKVTVDGTTYAAPLPDLMVHTPENVSESIGFLQGLHVEIRAHIVIDEEKPRIEFGSVYVKEWDDVGDYYVPTLPGGIASLEDLKELIDLYNQMPDVTNFETSLDSSFDSALLTGKYSKYRTVFRKLTRYGRHTYVLSGYEGKMYWNFKLRDDISFSSKDLEKFKYDHYFNNWYPFNIDFDGHKMTIDGEGYSSFDEVKRLLINIPSSGDEFQYIIEQYNLLPDIEKEFPYLTSFDAAMVYAWFKANTPYKELKVGGATCEWKQNEGKLYWVFTLTQDVVLSDGFTKFNFDYYYPFTINFNGHKIIIDDEEYSTFREVESRLMDIPDGTEELQYIIEQYNKLTDLSTLNSDDGLKKYTEKEAIGWFNQYDEAFKNLISHGAAYRWKQEEAKLYWTFTLRQDAGLSGTAQFKGTYYNHWYPFTIVFNGHHINGKGSWDDELENQLISNP